MTGRDVGPGRIPYGSDPNMVEAGNVAGVRWMTRRHPEFGSVNGYVQLPEGHPLRDCDDDDSVTVLLRERTGVRIHGGVTYFDSAGWIGFDTLHYADDWPGTDWSRIMHPTRDAFPMIEWTAGMVAEHAREIAAAVAGYPR